MNARELERALLAADPVDPGRLEHLDLAAMEADLLADAESGSASSPAPARVRPVRRRPLALGLGTVALAAVVALVVVIFGGDSGPSSPAYGAELVRFAESTPLLLLEGPGWRVQNATEHRTSGGIEGEMEFVTGKAVPYQTIEVHRDGTETSSEPPAERRRLVELQWHEGTLSEWSAAARQGRRGRWIARPVLDTTAKVDTRAEFPVRAGTPGDREMAAYWEEGGRVLELRAAVPNLTAFEERLGWLVRVDSQAWLEAMPAKVVKAADFEAAVGEVLKGVPLPQAFAISRVPDEGLTTDREAIIGKAIGTVSCLWFRQWGEARRTGDTAAEAEAEKAMATAPHWPALDEVEATNGYAPLVIELAKAMQKGYWEWHGHHRDLLAHAEGLDCARMGLPLLPEKMKRQREHGVPPPPD